MERPAEPWELCLRDRGPRKAYGRGGPPAWLRPGTRARRAGSRRAERPARVRPGEPAASAWAAATASRDEAEYVRRLRKAGIAVRPRYAKGGTDSVTGYSVGLRTTAGDKIDWFGASSLAHDLSLPALRASWGSTEAERRAAAELWSSPCRAGGRGAEEQVYAAATQGEAAAYLGRVVDRLSTLAVDDPGWVAARPGYRRHPGQPRWSIGNPYSGYFSARVRAIDAARSVGPVSGYSGRSRRMAYSSATLRILACSL